MKLFIKIGIILAAPYLFFVYWRNSMKEIGDLHATAEINWTTES